MAEIQGKRSVRKKQSTRSRRRPRSHSNKNTYRRVFHFPQTHGKLVQDVEFSTCPDYHNVSINFQDQTCLNFSIETGFTLETDYSDWKTGNQRVIRAWKPVRGKE